MSSTRSSFKPRSVCRPRARARVSKAKPATFHATQRGVGLIESLLTVSVLALLVTLAAPALRSMLDAQAALQQAQALRDALRLARATAVQRGERVTVCALSSDSNPQDQASLQCVASASKDWNAGWMVFVDRGQRSVFEAGDQVLAVEQPQPHQLPWAATASAVSFERTGTSSWAAMRLNVLPRPRAQQPLAPAVLSICINKPGRSRIVEAPSCSG